MRVAERYELLEALGDGGLGTVYRAVDITSGETVALKRLRSELTAAAPEMVARFADESARLRELRHPNLIRVRAVFEHEAAYYVIMDFLPGDSLENEIVDGGLPFARIVSIAAIVADVLARAHDINLVHQNVKPGNILFTGEGSPCLTDFGLTRIKLSKAAREANMITGTTYYISPDVLQTQTIEPSVDLWALGITLFEMVTGRRPFLGDRVLERFRAILDQPTPGIESLRPDVPAGLARLIYSMLEKHPTRRVGSAHLVKAELEQIGRELAS